MPDIERPQETAFLKAKYIVEHKISELKITSEPEMKETQFGDKLECEVAYNGQQKSDPNKWTINKTSTIALFDKFGKDTKTWINKPLPVTVSGEGEKMAIMVDKVRLG